MSLLTPRVTYAPFHYPKAYEYWELQQQSHWLASEISMAGDINDWRVNLTPGEKNLVGNILKSFTQTEVFVQDYWAGKVLRWFKHPEIQMLAATFASFESIHAVSYALLNQSLGLEDFSAFLHEPTAKAKIDRLINVKGKSKRDIALSLAVFSAFNEGVSLFSSFAILLNFSRFNKLKGVGQIISFSIKDECYSSDTEILTPRGWTLLKDLLPTDKVAQFCPSTNEISFVVPSRIIKEKHVGKMIQFNSQKLPVRLCVTPGHQMVYKWERENMWSFQQANDFKSASTTKMIPVSGTKTSGRDNLSPLERFLIALQADGHIFRKGEYTGERCGTVPVVFTFAKERKILRFREILQDNQFRFEETHRKSEGNKAEQTLFKVHVPVSIAPHKTLSEWVDLSDVSNKWASQFIEEIGMWDGHTPTNPSSGKYLYYSSTDPSNVDIVQAVAAIAGKWVTRSIEKDSRSETFSDVHSAYIHNQSTKRLGSVVKTEIDYNDYVYCVTVPTSAVVVRRQGCVAISGNCLHSEAGVWLFNQLCTENPDLMDQALKEEIYDAARLTIKLEDEFIDKAFELGDVEGLTAADVKNFIRHRCNNKLADLGLKKLWKNIDRVSLENLQWFDVLSSGVNHADFFASRVSDYSKGSMDFSRIFDE